MKSFDIARMIDHSILHPTMTDEELLFIIDSIKQVAVHHLEWGKDYIYNKHTNEFIYKDEGEHKHEMVRGWFIIKS